MRRLVEFPLEQGGSVLVESVEVASGGDVTRGLRPAAERVTEVANRSFEKAVASIQPAAQSLLGRLRTLGDPPDEVQVEFGLDLHAEAGAFIAAASTGANFKVILTWHRQQGRAGLDDPGIS